MGIKYICLIFFTTSLYAQKDSLKTIKLEPVMVKVSRIQANNISLPASISKANFKNDQNNRQQLSLKEYLTNIPGLFALNANNFSQDIRIAIRGFGSRSAFGIRGVKILVDGIPETTPDGQGQIDNLNLAIIKNIEVIRGPSSALYGNASGGVISINTIDNFDANFIKIGSAFGSYNMQQLQFTAGFKKKKTNYIFQGSRIKTDGFRIRSGFENYNFNLRMLHQFSKSSKINFQLNYNNSPYADDSGGLTLEELSENREQARQRNIDFKTGEKISQFKFGTNYTKNWKFLTFNTYSFYSFRNFYGLLPFEFGGIVDLNRNYFGNGSNLTFLQSFRNGKNKLQLGYDFSLQKDKRERFRNIIGTQGGQTFSQAESFDFLGIYILDHFSIKDLTISAGLRFDNNNLKANDKFFADGDGSGNMSLNSLNPSLGISYRLNPKNYIFSNYSTSFETPALSELSSNPEAEVGFNNDLKAQKANNYELGYKFMSESAHLEISLFYIETKDDLVPYELDNFPDRNFFRNAGNTSRIGAEFFYSQTLSKNLNFKTSYTYSNFKYSNYTTPSRNFKNKHLPGIPKHFASLSFNYRNKTGLSLDLRNQYVGSIYTNDGNSVKDNDYIVLNFDVGYKLNIKSSTLLPFIGINNLLNTKYNDNIRINAVGGRYYEPAPEVNIYAGVRLII